MLIGRRRLPQRMTRSDTLFRYTTLFGSLFEVEAVVAEGSACLLACRIPRRFKFFVFPDDAHAAPAAAGGSFENDRIADFIGYRNPFFYIIDQPVRAGNGWHTRTLHGLLGRSLVAHLLDLLGRGPDELDAILVADG